MWTDSRAKFWEYEISLVKVVILCSDMCCLNKKNVCNHKYSLGIGLSAKIGLDSLEQYMKVVTIQLFWF